MQKTIVCGKEARAKILAGAKKISDAIGVTIGPAGKCVLIARGYVADYGLQHLPIHVSKDGYTVSRHIKLSDPLENVGAQIIQEAAQKTVDLAGDGTTATSILAEAIMREGMALIEEGANSQELKKGIDKAVEYVVSDLKRMAIPIGEGVEEIRKIAYVSANNDNEIADFIADAYSEIGKDGIIDIEEARGTKTSISIVDGFKFDKGWESHMFITNQSKNECILENPLIFLYDRRLTKMNDVHPLCVIARNNNRPLLVVAECIDGEALAFLGVNNAQGTIRVCAVNSPSFNDTKMEMMEDIAALTGATFITDLKGIGLESVELYHLGSARKVVISKENTTIIGGNKDSIRFEELVNNLKMNLTQAESEEQKRPIEARIARLMGSIAVISVGGTTETEMKERKDRCDDAIRATKSAITEGYLPGGGIAFINAIKESAASLIPNDGINDQRKGIGILLGVLYEPFIKICLNAGLHLNEIMGKILDNIGGNIGYNAKTGQIENLLESGIIDPVRVLRCALENAASVAGMALITETIICDTI